MRNHSCRAWVAAVLVVALAAWAGPAAGDDEEPLPPILGGANSGEPAGSPGPAQRPGAETTDDAATPALKFFKMPDEWKDARQFVGAVIGIHNLLTQHYNQQTVCDWAQSAEWRRGLLAGRNLVAQLDAPDQNRWAQAVFMASLAAGYPADALPMARQFAASDPKQGWNWVAMYRSGMLCGDQAAVKEALDGLGKVLGARGRAEVQMLRDRTEAIGKTIDFTIDLEGGKRVSAASARGKVVVLDLWMNVEMCRAAYPQTKSLFDAFKGYAEFRMVGVNMDRPEARNGARLFVQREKTPWPQCFEDASERPVSLKFLHARIVPCQAVANAEGKVIFVGQTTETALTYAVRAGLVAANKGKVPTSQPDAAKAEDWPASPAKAGTPGPRLGDRPGSQRPVTVAPVASEGEAHKLLKQAQAFEKAGAKAQAIAAYRRVTKEYPDTDAAVTATTRLLVMERFAP